MYQTKVSIVKQHSTSQGDYIVCKGKLIVLPTEEDDDSIYVKSNKSEHWAYLRPIIVSEIEEIQEGDKYLDKFRNICTAERVNVKSPGYVHHVKAKEKEGYDSFSDQSFKHIQSNSDAFKILALPNHFSDAHLQAIADGKMKICDEVLIRCTHSPLVIHLNQQDQITLFPAKQSLEELAKEFSESVLGERKQDNIESIGQYDFVETAFKAGYKKCMENNNLS